MGSTAWMRSIVTGARAIAAGLGSATASVLTDYEPLPWDTERLIFAVREPFPSIATQAGLVFGTIERGRQLALRSLMPDEGVIFSDGIEADYLRFTSGIEARIGVAEHRGALIM